MITQEDLLEVRNSKDEAILVNYELADFAAYAAAKVLTANWATAI